MSLIKEERDIALRNFVDPHKAEFVKLSNLFLPIS